MFTKELCNLTLTSDIANEMFPNICGKAFGSDNSFLATLRALVAPHMTKEDTLWLEVRTRNDRDSVLKNYGEKDGVRYLSDGIANNTIFVCGLNGTDSSIATSMKYLDASFAEVFPNFKEEKTLKVFVQQQANARFYINEEDRCAAIFVAQLNIRTWHLIQSLTSVLVPWYFPNKANDVEKDLALSLTLKTATSYERKIEEFAKKYNFRNAKIQKMLSGFELRSVKKNLHSVKVGIENQENRIAQIMKDYTAMLNNLADLKIKQSGLEYQLKEWSDDDSEVIDYFKCNTHLNPISVTDDYMEIIVDTTIENYDPDMFERMFANKKSYLFTGYNPTAEVFQNFEAREKMISALFGEDACLKIKVCAYYKLDFSGYVSTIKRYTYPQEYSDFLTNPHFYFFACIGNNEPLINQLLRERNYIAAIEQCSSSAKNLNLSEGSQTVAPFLGLLFARDCKSVILMPDGSSCTPTEAYEWLVAQEKVEDTQEVEK